MGMEETIVRLRITSFVHSPEVITQTIGLSCDRSWYAGDIRPQTIIVEKSHGWVLGSGLPATAGVEEQVEALVRMLESRADALKALAQSARIELSCVMYFGATAGVVLDKTMVERIARLGAGVEFDLYSLD
jgi:hypothetical protein